MDILTIVLVLLVVAAIWLVVELVLTVRKARPVLDSAEKAIQSVQPAIDNVNRLVEDLKPLPANANAAVQRIDPVLVQAADVLGQVDVILGDAAKISKTAGNATSAVGDAAETLASKARLLFTRSRANIRAAMPAVSPASDEEHACDHGREGAEASLGTGEPEEVGYFTYPETVRPETAPKAE